MKKYLLCKTNKILSRILLGCLLLLPVTFPVEDLTGEIVIEENIPEEDEDGISPCVDLDKETKNNDDKQP